MGHEGCCFECQKNITEMHTQIAEIHTLLFELAQSMSALGESPMARAAFKSMGVSLPGRKKNGENH